jgi:hypothetical protein
MAFNRTAVSLELVKLAAEDLTYRDVLSAISDGIRAAEGRLDDAAQRGDDDWLKAVNDEECDLLENLLGAAYVVCQTQITAVTARALAVRKCRLGDGKAFTAFGEGKADVRALGDALPFPATATKVELVWALANYFKHREEWDKLEWSALDKQSRRTAEVLEQVQLASATTGNLRRGFSALHSNSYAELESLAAIVDAWSAKVLAVCKAEATH